MSSRTYIALSRLQTAQADDTDGILSEILDCPNAVYDERIAGNYTVLYAYANGACFEFKIATVDLNRLLK